MHDALGVRGRQRAGDLARNVQRAIHGERTARDFVAQAVARDELQHQEYRAVREFAEVGRGRHVGVLDVARGHRLAFEACHHLGHAGQLATQDLHRQALAHQHVLGGVHLAHATLAHQRVDAIALGE